MFNRTPYKRIYIYATITLLLNETNRLSETFKYVQPNNLYLLTKLIDISPKYKIYFIFEKYIWILIFAKLVSLFTLKIWYI